MRSAQEAFSSGGSGTPIYDALYSEYRRLFRALPGDRSGEEGLRFNGFAPRTEPSPGYPAPGRHRTNRPQPALPPARSDNRRPDC